MRARFVAMTGLAPPTARRVEWLDEDDAASEAVDRAARQLEARVLDSLAPYLSRGVLYAHVVERLADDGAVADALARMTLELEGRVHGRGTEVGYRDEARARRANAGQDGHVVVSVLVAARPTAQKWRPVLRTRDAKALRDRILPIDPTHVLATALVVTPEAQGPTFDAGALREAFPELTPLDETAASAMEPESAQEPESDAETERDAETDPALLSALLPELPSPVAVIELEPATVDETVAATLRRLEQHFGLPMPMNSPLTDVLRTAAADLDSAREEYTRERLLTALEVSVNAVLRGARREERLTRLVGSGGRVFVDARFLAIDDDTRDALRLRTDVLFAPRPFESLRDVIPMLATLAVFGTFAIHWLGPGVSPSYLIGTAAASLLSRWWVARSNRGLALGAAWKTKYVTKPREPAPP